MHKINMYKFSKSINKIDSSQFQLTFDLQIIEDEIKFVNISLEDKYNLIQNILDVRVEAKSFHTLLKKSLGEVQSSLWALNPNIPGNDTWDWQLDSNDISAIETIRRGDIDVKVEIKILAELKEKEKRIVPLLGNGGVRISESDWLSFIRHFGYSTKYGLSLPATLTNDNGWLQAYELLHDAREHLQRGKTYDALRQCLSVLESYIDSKERGGPYRKDVWEGILYGIAPQKKEGIVGLLSGVATYLNKVGHHRNSRQKENGILTHIPIDQYEAELMLAISHLVVTYLEKLREEGGR